MSSADNQHLLLLLQRARQLTQKRPLWKTIVCCEEDENRHEAALDLYDKATQKSLAVRDKLLAGNIALEMVEKLPGLSVGEKTHWLHEATKYHISHLRQVRSEEAFKVALATTTIYVEAQSSDDKAAQAYELLHDAWSAIPSETAETLLTKALQYDCNLTVQLRIREKLAVLFGKMKKYKEAAVEFEALATSAQEDTRHKYSVRKYVFRAGLCRLANGEFSVPDYFKLFPIMYDSTTELLIIKELAECTEIVPVTTKFKSLLQGDPWIVDVLWDIKVRKETSLGEDIL